MMGREVLVIKRETLFKDGFFTGFVPIHEGNFIDVINKNYEYRERGEELEHDINYKQFASYVWIINPQTKKILAYKRAPNEAYTEARLRNKWSCGVGGHIDKDTEGGSKDPLNDAMMRELKEEVKMNNYPTPKIVGLVTLDNRNVENYHIGVVAIAETTENVEKNDAEVAELGFYSISEIERLFADPNNDIELFTQLSWSFMKKYVESR